MDGTGGSSEKNRPGPGINQRYRILSHRLEISSGMKIQLIGGCFESFVIIRGRGTVKKIGILGELGKKLEN